MRGLQLRRQRYSDATEQLAAEALAREQWTPEQWRSWREQRLAVVLDRAATRVPYYREQWNERRWNGDPASWELLEQWPILEKESLRRNARALVADDCDIRQLVHDHTSGTSGKSLDLWFRRETVRQWYALAEARWKRWYGVSSEDRWGILGGQLITPIAQARPPFWVWNAALRQLYLSSYHLSLDFIPSYLDAIARHRLTYLLGYTSSLYSLAREMLRSKVRDLKLKVVITNAEPVYDYQRQAISEAFQCPVRETYGMAETVAAASECEAGRLHLWPEAGWIETTATSDLISTGLLNADMPLVRYRAGDRLLLADPVSPCACGRTLPQIASIEGRIDDVLYTSDGRRIGRLDPVFKNQLPVREAQIIQESLTRVRVLYVPDEGFDRNAARSIVEKLQERMGNIEVLLEETREIPRGASGKFRAVICKLPAEQIRELK